MTPNDLPSERETAEAAAEVAVVSAALVAAEESGKVYVSSEKGPQVIEGPEGQNPQHSQRVLDAAAEGRRTISAAQRRALKRQADSDYHSTN